MICQVIDLSRLSEEAAARQVQYSPPTGYSLAMHSLSTQYPLTIQVYTIKPHFTVLLDGYTSAGRTAAMAMRPAPVQLQYVSQGGSSGKHDPNA